MQSSQSMNEMPAKKNQTPLIIAIVLVLSCCCCLVLAGAGYYGYFTIRNVSTELPSLDDFEPLPTDLPDVVPPSLNTEEPSLDDSLTDVPDIVSDIGEPPAGGLGNDILKNDTWQYVASAAVGQGCDVPVGADSTIEVLQEPDASGVWVEKWTVACRSGDSYAYEVEYILDNTGTTFNIKPIP